VKERLTSQRQIILDYLKSVKTHPSAEIIYKEVKEKLPRISLGTVYRNLEFLEEKGQIKEIAAEIKRFDGDLTEHHHFICKNCQRIFDVFKKFAGLKLKKTKLGKVQNYQIYFYGLCQKCQKKK
jgi:Fe2+ or Zn2+ uptake regulation protein